MADDENAIEDLTFIVEEVGHFTKESIEAVVQSHGYIHEKIPIWTNLIMENILSRLAKLDKPFKYVVTCMIMQKNGAGLHMASSCFGDPTIDGSCTVRWENKTMYVVANVYGFGI